MATTAISSSTTPQKTDFSALIKLLYEKEVKPATLTDQQWMEEKEKRARQEREEREKRARLAEQELLRDVQSQHHRRKKMDTFASKGSAKRAAKIKKNKNNSKCKRERNAKQKALLSAEPTSKEGRPPSTRADQPMQNPLVLPQICRNSLWPTLHTRIQLTLRAALF